MSKPLSEQQLAETRAREAETRRGPWEVADALDGDGYPGHLWVVRTPDNVSGDESVVVSVGDRAVAEFIAGAREDVPALLGDLTQLRGAAHSAAVLFRSVAKRVRMGHTPNTATLRQAAADLDRLAGKDTDGSTQPPAGESTQPTDFFQPGHAYTHRDGSDFRCLTVAPHPVTGELRAFGWRIRNGWHEGATLDPDDWQQYDGCQPPTGGDTARAETVLPELGPEGSCTGIALNGVHTQVFPCQTADAHELHLWRTGLEWFTCRGEAR
jgi:hypothetical protein